MTNAEIQAFLAVWEHKSISKAAEALYLSQSALSTKLKTLERELGCSLLIRGKGQRNLSLTEAGEAFLPLAAQYVEIVEKMLSLRSNVGPHTLRVSSLSSMSQYLLTPVYQRFMTKNPGTGLEMQDLFTGAAYTSMEKGLTDLAFTSGRRTSQMVETKPAFSERMVLLCAESGGYSKTVHLEELDPHDEVFVGWSDDFIRWHRETFGPRPENQVKLELPGQIGLFARRGRSWAILPRSVADSALAEGGLRLHETEFEIPPRITNYLHTAEPEKMPLIESFLDCLREVFREENFPGVELLM